MSESKLVIPTPKSCSVCIMEKGYCGLYDDFRCMALRGTMLKVHKGFIEERHPQCPLKPIAPNSNVESALAIVNVKLYEREYYDNHYSTSSDYDYKEVDLTPIKAELSKIPALEKEVQDKDEEINLLKRDIANNDIIRETAIRLGKNRLQSKLNAIEEMLDRRDIPTNDIVMLAMKIIRSDSNE